MKRVLLLLLMLCFFTTSVAFASQDDKVKFEVNQDEIMIFEADEITDDMALLERAKKGISDVPAPQGKVKLHKAGKEIKDNDIKVYTTTQKLKAKRNKKTGEIVTLYKQDSIAEIPKSTFEEKDNKVASLTRLASLSMVALTDSGDKNDSTSNPTVLSTNTIYYEAKACPDPYIGQRNYYKFTSVGNKWKIIDYQVSLSNGVIGYYRQGGAVNSSCQSQGGKLWGEDISIGTPSSGVEKKVTPTKNTSWYVSVSSSLDQNLAHGTITITRGSSSWSFQHINNFDPS